VDDNPLAVPGGSFRWDDIPVRGRIDAEEDYREVRILGSWTPVVPTGGKVAVACRRALIYNKLQRFLSIGDEWSSKGPGPPRTITWRWHFPPETRITLQKGGAGLEAALPGGAVAVLEISPAADLEVRDGWVAPVYSRRLPAPVVVVQRGSNGGEDRQSFRLAYRPPSGDVSA
jgi:hypothetical protein